MGEDMTNEELILKYKEGDKNVLVQILQQNKGLIYMVANRFRWYCTGPIDLDDLVQEGNIGLLLAVDKYKFDIDHQAKFSVYAYYWIKQRIYKYLKYKGKKSIEVSLSTDTGEGITLEEQLQEKEDYILKVEECIWYQDLREEINRVMKEELTARQKEVIELRYGFSKMEPATLKEIADILNISTSGADSILCTSLTKMRRSNWGRARMMENVKGKEKYFRNYK